MELKEFVKEIFVQITDGVIEAAKICKEKGAQVNPLMKENTELAHTQAGNSATLVKFHVGLCESSEATSKNGIGVFLASVGVGITGSDHQKADTITSVDFSIPIKLPYDTGNEGMVYGNNK